MRGIRQGDRILSYLFILYIERLSHIIKDCISQKLWNPFHVAKNAPFISHFFSLMTWYYLYKVAKDKWRLYRVAMLFFFVTSSTKINLQKTKIF